MDVRFRRLRLISCLVLAVCLAAAGLPLSARADTPLSAPLTAGNTRNGMVRVRLSSLGSPSVLNLTVYGSYTVNGVSSQSLPSGAAVRVNFNASSGQLTLTVNGTTQNMGSSFKLRRHETSGQNGIKVAQSRVPGNLYPGDFQFLVRGSAGSYSLYVIVQVYMEDYLYGVLPYELGNSSPLEALKAQAVAARTYTMRAMNAASSALYDVVDTTSDQVYSGTPSGNANCKAAVDATKGIVAQNGSSLTATYYTASNGGQTESIQNAWGVTSCAYLKVKDDPYDLASPEARKASFTVKASGAQSNTQLGALLNQKAAAVFGSGATVTSVSAVTPRSPKYSAPSRLYTQLDFAVTYSRAGQAGSGVLTFDIFKELEAALSMSLNSGSNELWSVTPTATGFTVTARRYGHGIGMSQRGAIQMAKGGATYDQILGFYFEGCTRVQYTLTRSILSPVVPGQTSQEQWTQEQPAPIESAAPASPQASAQVLTPSNSLNLRAGPSTDAKVLRTIPRGETVAVLERGGEWCQVAYANQTGYVMSRYLVFPDAATPAPTAAPAEPGASYARVTTPSGSLNLRQAGRDSARILTTIPQNELVLVHSRGSAWCFVTYNGVSGFVMTKFLTFVSADPVTAAPAATPSPQTTTPVPAATPTAAPAEPGASYARVTTPSGSLNLRQAGRDNARILATIPQNELVLVHSRGPLWCSVTYNGVSGFVMTKFLTFVSADPVTAAPAATSSPQTAAPVPAATPAPTAAPAEPGVSYARVTTPSGSLNLRQAGRDNARILATIPQNELVLVRSRGSAWCSVSYNGMSGFVMTKFLTFTSVQPATPAPTAAPAPQPTAAAPVSSPVKDPTLRELRTAVLGQVMSTASSLNLRSGCSTASPVLLEMPKYEYLVITAVGDTWCAVTYEGQSGYCMTKYLEFTVYE